jgi:phosphopantothenoylcysteine decarboxylase/phosphopantothenate--cysteine ligase
MALIALGVTGGIGAYKAVEVCRGLQKAGHEVVAVMTEAATRFVGPLTFEAITRHPVITSQWVAPPETDADSRSIEHIALADRVALLLVVPCTANVIGKFAHGIADDFLSSMYLATTAPVLLAPAMNSNMLAHPAVQANLQVLAERGVRFVEPGDGYLACGWMGKGRLADPDEIVAAALRTLEPASAPAAAPAPALEPAPAPHVHHSAGFVLRGRRVLVTAGPTFEDIDPVRFVGNRSSGRMGFAIAEEAMRRGADVILVAGPTSVAIPEVSHLVRVRSAADMHAAVMEHSVGADVVIMAAAVADYTPQARADQKMAKKDGPLTLTLNRTRDILADLGAQRDANGGRHPVLVGFAAETSDVVRKARDKRLRKHADLIVANDVSQDDRGFEVSTNAATLVSDRGDVDVPLQAKSGVAAAILDAVQPLLDAAGSAPHS